MINQYSTHLRSSKLEETMRSQKQEAWYNDQKCISVHKDVHNKLNRVRDEYIKRYHRNITLGYIVEMLLINDEVIANIYNEVLEQTRSTHE